MYRRDIDGLRAISVLSVLFFHAGFDLFQGGFIGVDIFFVISGYLITSIIIRDLEIKNFSLKIFYMKRARRILPVLIFIIIFLLPFAWYFMLPSQMKEFSQSLIAVIFFLSNIFFFLKTDYFDDISETKPLLHTWSLGIEEQFYLIFPFLLIIFWQFGKKIIFFLIFFLILISLFLSENTQIFFKVSNFYLTHARIWELLVGSLLSILISEIGVKKSNILSTVGLGLIFFSIFLFNKDSGIPGFITVIPVLGVVLVITFAEKNTIVAKLLSLKIITGIGIISYSIYLWHQPIFSIAKMYLSNDNQLIMLTLCILTIFVSIVSWRFIEKPFRDKNKINDKFFLLITSISIIFILITGFLGHYKKGDFYRWHDSIIDHEINREKFNDFVWEKKNKYNLKSFEGVRKKILVIGDSNSGDFINALDYSEYRSQIEIASITINAGCGNLYIKKEKFIKNLNNDSISCIRSGDLFSNESHDLIKNADLVIFASAWRKWEVNYIQQSYENLIKVYGSKFLFWGNKDLDFPSVKKLYETGQFKINTTYPKRLKTSQINDDIKVQLGEFFIDPYKFFCRNKKCSVVNNEGDLIIYDGFHLTIKGAMFFGEKLSREYDFIFF